MTLNGCVLPIGGVKEKVLAARRSGVRVVVFPEGNRHEYEELSNDLKQVGGARGRDTRGAGHGGAGKGRDGCGKRRIDGLAHI